MFKCQCAFVTNVRFIFCAYMYLSEYMFIQVYMYILPVRMFTYIFTYVHHACVVCDTTNLKFYCKCERTFVNTYAPCVCGGNVTAS